jgi:hypothetical protein
MQRGSTQACLQVAAVGAQPKGMLGGRDAATLMARKAVLPHIARMRWRSCANHVWGTRS